MPELRPPKTWLITGASRGQCHEWALAALERGDRVAAAARRLSGLEELAEMYGEAVLPVPPARDLAQLGGGLRGRAGTLPPTTA